MAALLPRIGERPRVVRVGPRHESWSTMNQTDGQTSQMELDGAATKSESNMGATDFEKMRNHDNARVVYEPVESFIVRSVPCIDRAS
jgi:hypothetical protein